LVFASIDSIFLSFIKFKEITGNLFTVQKGKIDFIVSSMIGGAGCPIACLKRGKQRQESLLEQAPEVFLVKDQLFGKTASKLKSGVVRMRFKTANFPACLNEII